MKKASSSHGRTSAKTFDIGSPCAAFEISSGFLGVALLRSWNFGETKFLGHVRIIRPAGCPTLPRSGGWERSPFPRNVTLNGNPIHSLCSCSQRLRRQGWGTGRLFALILLPNPVAVITKPVNTRVVIKTTPAPLGHIDLLLYMT